MNKEIKLFMERLTVQAPDNGLKYKLLFSLEYLKI